MSPTQLPLLPTVVQRWRSQRALYRPVGEPIDTKAYGVEVISESAARAFVLEHHYSRTYPAARFRAGLFRARPIGGTELVGVAVFSVPANVATMNKYLGLDCQTGAELGRFVLVDDVPANGETFFLSRALKLLRKEKPVVAGVVSFSDPFPRTTAAGDVVMPGHVGCIYQAASAHYLGRAAASTLLLDPHGRVLSARTLSKIRNEEQGLEYALRALLDAGAPARAPHEDLRAYCLRAVRDGPFRKLKHPGNHAYAWALNKATCEMPIELPYPKRSRPSAIPARDVEPTPTTGR